ncbi:MAG: GAF domain-containing sensor histidine kinase [Acidobacteriota bacterium]|nr:GAF domain-containing sensor histidine kinase [Acidobacteriota bacterium]
MDPVIKELTSLGGWSEALRFLEASPANFVTTVTYPDREPAPETTARIVVLGQNRKTGFFHLPKHADRDQIHYFCRMLLNNKKAGGNMDLPGFLQDFAGHLRDKTNLEDISNHIIASVAELFDAEGASILLLDDERGVLRFVSTFSHKMGVSRGLSGVEISLDEGIAGWVARNQQPELVPDAARDVRFNADIDERTDYETRDMMAAPIILGDELLGVLEVVNGRSRGFSRWDLPSFSVVAAVVAIFMEKAQLSLQKRRVRSAEDKAEIASSVLHNIGNVINSVNVACSLMESKLEHSRLDKLIMALNLMQDHIADLPGFFADNPKGKMLPEFLFRLQGQMEDERDNMLEEIRKVSNKAQLMQDIIETQQTISKVGSAEAHDLIQIVEEALTVQKTNLNANNITVVKDFHTDRPVRGLKSKMVHTLINLIKNGQEAMLDTPEGERVLKLMTDEGDNGKVYLTIQDTGTGMTQGTLDRLFTHGFTTKKDGHGFGLASCAQIMSEMGGSIEAKSDGPGKGSSFILSFPTMAR